MNTYITLYVNFVSKNYISIFRPVTSMVTGLFSFLYVYIYVCNPQIYYTKVTGRLHKFNSLQSYL